MKLVFPVVIFFERINYSPVSTNTSHMADQNLYLKCLNLNIFIDMVKVFRDNNVYNV